MTIPPTPPMSPAGARSTWPTVLGVITLVMSVLTFFGSGCSMAVPAFLAWEVDTIGHMMSPAQVRQLEQMSEAQGWFIAAGLVSMTLAVVLLVAGLKLLKRRPTAAPLYRWWAGIQIAWSVVGTVISFQFMVFGGGGDAMQDAGQLVGQIFGLSIGILWGVALPVFILIWFARRPIRAEVATWTVADEPA